MSTTQRNLVVDNILQGLSNVGAPALSSEVILTGLSKSHSKVARAAKCITIGK